MDESRIQLLPKEVANQIAAGEVIERPASVVKELLENALDAKASKITIDLGYGGLNSISVSDNGTGIYAEDLPLALAAHATSKISQLNDLSQLYTMGFRGEALASIASIARVSITSRRAAEPHAMKIEREDDQIICLPAARNQGTTVEVRDLFYNAPVRRKFLKSAAIEFQAIESLVKRFALSVPEIGIKLVHDGHCYLELSASTSEKTRHARVQKIFGKSFMQHAIWLDEVKGSVRLYGFVSNGLYQRSQNDKQWVYLNRRMIKDKLINHALRQAYDPFLDPGKHASFLLYLELSPDEVDVNVHPTKHEVRFENARWIHDFILSSLGPILNSAAPETNIFPTSPPSLSLRYPPLAAAHAVTSSDRQWILLNSKFILLYIEKSYYLVDGRALYRSYLKELMRGTPIPMRRLLVPVYYRGFPASIRYLCELKPLLLTKGFALEGQAADCLLVEGIPTALSQLNIGSFLDAVSHKTEEIDFIALMIMHTDCDLEDLSASIKTELFSYFTEIINTTSLRADWFRVLNQEQCEELMGG